jgi:hypothetical protein
MTGRRASSLRRGSVLIIIAGLCTILLTLSMTFLVKMRMESEESILLIRDAQARIMLVSALQYIQESSRLGWRDMSKVATDPWGDGAPGFETFGWTDVRDGTIGPRGPRYVNPGFQYLASAIPVDPLRQGLLPLPAWWPASQAANYPNDVDGKPSRRSPTMKGCCRRERCASGHARGRRCAGTCTCRR